MPDGKGVKMPEKYMTWKRGAALLLANQARRAGFPFGKGPIRVSVVAVFDRPLSRPASVKKEDWGGGRCKRWAKPDADNILKAVCDALQDGGIVSDDCHIEIGSVARWYGSIGELPSVLISVEEVT
jgi:Holliday junction resolvase RusA-like endonuclease